MKRVVKSDTARLWDYSIVQENGRNWTLTGELLLLSFIIIIAYWIDAAVYAGAVSEGTVQF